MAATANYLLFWRNNGFGKQHACRKAVVHFPDLHLGIGRAPGRKPQIHAGKLAFRFQGEALGQRVGIVNAHGRDVGRRGDGRGCRGMAIDVLHTPQGRNLQCALPCKSGVGLGGLALELDLLHAGRGFWRDGEGTGDAAIGIGHL